MYRFASNTDVPRSRWLCVTMLLIGLCVVHAVGKERTPPRGPDGTVPLEADLTEVSPNAGLVPIVAPEPLAPIVEVWPDGLSFEEMLGMRPTCPCFEAGAWVIQFGLATALRGNLYTIDPDGPDRILCEFCQRLNPPEDVAHRARGDADAAGDVAQRGPICGLPCHRR